MSSLISYGLSLSTHATMQFCCDVFRTRSTQATMVGFAFSTKHRPSRVSLAFASDACKTTKERSSRRDHGIFKSRHDQQQRPPPQPLFVRTVSHYSLDIKTHPVCLDPNSILLDCCCRRSKYFTRQHLLNREHPFHGGECQCSRTLGDLIVFFTHLYASTSLFQRRSLLFLSSWHILPPSLSLFPDNPYQVLHNSP